MASSTYMNQGTDDMYPDFHPSELADNLEPEQFDKIMNEQASNEEEEWFEEYKSKDLSVIINYINALQMIWTGGIEEISITRSPYENDWYDLKIK